MKNIREKIRKTLMSDEFDSVSSKTKEEIVEKLFIYHEELLFQNEELKRVNNEIEEIKLKYKKLFKEAPIGYVFLDEKLEIIDYNDEAKKYIQSGKDLGRKLSDFIHPSSQDDYYLHFRKQIKTSSNLESYINITVEENLRHYKLVSSPFYIGEEQFFQCALVDETSEIKKAKKIEKMSYQDALTKLYNRRFFNEELKRLDVERNLPLGIILADINGLKLINDSFGHQVGDEFLIKTAKAFKSELRGDEIIARLGGDEFAILISSIKKNEIMKVVHRIQNSFAKIEINDIKFSVACGFAIKENADENINVTFKRAEDIMYQNKLLMKSNYHKNAIRGIITTLHEKHPREEKHSSRVRYYMEMFIDADQFDVSSKALLETTGMLHDIGKIALDYTILEKPGTLSREEFDAVKKHPEVGYRVLRSAGVYQEILEGVLYHHERYDGNGYPEGLKGEEIPLLARILTVCDAYDAMRSDRPYREALTTDEAVSELKNCSGTQFDPDITDFFIKMLYKRKEV
jgi:diguanylate cyclase (GGDEF)-like protein